MALKPETIRRRQRTQLPRAPEESFRAQAGPTGANEELSTLLAKMLALAERETLFTATMEFFPRLETALGQAGYLFSALINVENQLLPGATVTTYLPVAPGYSYIPIAFDYYSSLPWWLSAAMWVDSDIPAPPNAFWVRAPDRYSLGWKTLSRAHRFLRYTVINNHLINTINFCATHVFDVVTDDTYKMIEDVYLSPLVDYVREKAEQISGRPFP